MTRAAVAARPAIERAIVNRTGPTTSPSVRPATLLACAAFLLGAMPLAAQSADALVVNLPAGPSSLDPSWACSVEDVGFIQNFYVRLTQYGTKDGPGGTTMFDVANPQPYLAESWTISDDGKTYTFKLRDGFEFASGRAVTAQDVKYSLERTIKENGCGKYFILDGYLDPPLIQAIDTPDPQTVVIHLLQPDSNFLVNLAQPPASVVDPEVVEANGGVVAGQPSEYLSSNVAGSGPFLLESYSPNQRAVLVANPKFPGPGPASQRIEVNFISSPSTLLLQARSGQADVTMSLPKQAVKSLEADPNVKVVVYPVVNVQQIIPNNKRAPWDNQKVREAASYAIPYQQILDKIAYGYGTPFFGAITPTMTEFNAAASEPRPFDMAKAKELMAESGLATPVPVELVIQEGDAIQQQVATIVQSTWKELGLEVAIKVAPPAEYQDLAFGHKVQTLMRLDGPAHGLGAAYFLGYDMRCTSIHSLSQMCIPGADDLLAKARASADPAERQALFDEINTLWKAYTPRMPIFEDKQAIVLGSDVKTFFYNPMPDYRAWAKQ